MKRSLPCLLLGLAAGALAQEAAVERERIAHIINGLLMAAGTSFDIEEAASRILYAKYTGTEIKLDNEDYIVLNEKDILAKLVV